MSRAPQDYNQMMEYIFEELSTTPGFISRNRSSRRTFRYEEQPNIYLNNR